MKNSTARKLLEQRYGKGCFMERAGIRKITYKQEQELKKTIKGFKKLDRRITYHHLRQKSQGGDVSIENGANLAAYNHEWLHQQSPEVREKINQELRDFKFHIDTAIIQAKANGLEIDAAEIVPDFSETMEIPVYNIPKSKGRHKKGSKYETFNRAKVKRETEQMIKEEFER